MAELAKWNFDEPSGPFIDLTGNGHDWAAVGNTVRIPGGGTDGTGYSGNSLGQSATTEDPGPAIFGQTALRTLSFWANFTSAFTGWIFEYHRNTGDTAHWGFLSLSGNMGFRGRNTSSSLAYASRPAVLDGAWHFWTGVFDGTAVYLYFDGALVTSVALTGTLLTDIDVINIFNRIGSGNQIRHLRVFDEALNAAAVANLMAQPVALPAPTGRLKYESAPGVWTPVPLKTETGDPLVVKTETSPGTWEALP